MVGGIEVSASFVIFAVVIGALVGLVISMSITD